VEKRRVAKVVTVLKKALDGSSAVAMAHCQQKGFDGNSILMLSDEDNVEKLSLISNTGKTPCCRKQRVISTFHGRVTELFILILLLVYVNFFSWIYVNVFETVFEPCFLNSLMMIIKNSY
jgi:hypothetical protein